MSAPPSQRADFVLDASVALGAFFEDEQDAYSLAVWRSLGQAEAVVPALWHLELGNILSRALRAGRITAAALDAAWLRLQAIGLRTLPVEGHGQYWVERAQVYGLTAYDACYLDMALRLRLPLATKDRQLADAARRFGVAIHLQRLS